MATLTASYILKAIRESLTKCTLGGSVIEGYLLSIDHTTGDFDYGDRQSRTILNSKVEVNLVTPDMPAKVTLSSNVFTVAEMDKLVDAIESTLGERVKVFLA